LGTFAQDGFLATHGQHLNDVYRRLAVDVDRILEGARARDLRVELPTRIELVVNLGTAKALGVTIPQSRPSRGRGDPAAGRTPFVDGLATP
jgi:putative ABC transport system substrate-binding protein